MFSQTKKVGGTGIKNIYTKYSVKKVWANSVDPDQTAPIGKLLSILSVFLDTSNF